jgi:hypothetical protein
MAVNPSTNPKSSREDQPATPVALTLEEKLNQFWQKNRMVVLGLCGLVLIAILGKGAWERHQQSVEQEVESAYASASTPDQLRAFVAAHHDHVLAGIAELRMADDAYTAGKAADAIAGYDRALAILKDGAIVSRAQLGRALAKVQAGKTTEGMDELKKLANDSAQFKAARAEAAYQLATLSAAAGNTADAYKYIEQLEQIDPASVRARQAMMLRASLPPASAPAAAAAPTSVTPGQAPAEPKVQINLPKK